MSYCLIKLSTSFSNCLTTLWFIKIRFPCGKNLSKITEIRSGFENASTGDVNSPTCCWMNRMSVFSTDSASILFSEQSQINVKQVYPAPNHTAVFPGTSSWSCVKPTSNSGRVSSLCNLCISSSTVLPKTARLNWYSECTYNNIINSILRFWWYDKTKRSSTCGKNEYGSSLKNGNLFCRL